MICRTCGIDKPESDFYIDHYNYIRKDCKECIIIKNRNYAILHKEERKAYVKQYHIKNKEKRKLQDKIYKDKINSYKTECVKCGEKRLYVLDFHHIDPSKKEFNINRVSSKKDFVRIENEIKKCVNLCRNCHAEFHYIYGQKPQNPIKDLENYLNKK